MDRNSMALSHHPLGPNSRDPNSPEKALRSETFGWFFSQKWCWEMSKTPWEM